MAEDVTAQALALREREIAVEERKLEQAKRGRIVDWVKGLALPLASALASMAALVWQQQDKAAERMMQAQTALQEQQLQASQFDFEGYKFYFTNLTTLFSVDTEQQALNSLANIELMSHSFPNIYPNIRDDFKRRVQGSNLDIDVKYRMLDAVPQKAFGATASLAAPVEAIAGAAPPAAATAPAAAEALVPAPAPAAPAAEEERYRVYVHVAPGSQPGRIDPLRADLGRAGFAIGPRVEAVSFPFNAAEVRYYKEDQKADAEALAKLLTDGFAPEKLVFAAKSLAEQYPNLPDQVLEVWIPNPATIRRPRPAAAQVAPPSPRPPG
jgi:hypothetical protein